MPLPAEIKSLLPTMNSKDQFDIASTQYSDPQICRSPCETSSSALEPGMVITVEPGIYFNKFALDRLYYPSKIHSKYINKDVVERYMPVGGVRIEDDILITSKGYEYISTTAKGEEALKIIRGEK